ncbi:MAG: hypothetical protein Q9209_004227 [Squamulea sp. 1 TL-2023]
MKKLFHRKKNSAPSSPEQTPPRSRPARDVDSDPSLRTSRYESTSSAAMPHTGQYPLKGNNSALALSGRRSETYSRGQASGGVEPSPRPSTSNPYYGSLPAPRVTSASYDHEASGHPLSNRPSQPDLTTRSQRRHSARYNDPPVEDFSNLNLASTQTQADHTDYPSRQHYGRTNLTPRVQDSAYPTTSHRRHPYEDGSLSSSPYDGRTEPAEADSGFNRQARDNGPAQYGRHDHHDNRYAHHGTESSNNAFGNLSGSSAARIESRSIPRKEIPSQHSAAANQTAPLSSSNSDRNPYYEVPPPTRYSQSEEYPRARPEEDLRSRLELQDGRRGSAFNGRPSAHEVVDRAKGNTYDTQVVEKVAPAVVHETVHKNVHHVREEHITKEIHNHDVYHRILPIIDVEVLPPRHFLPVEGGGLVEISGKEVPGRGNNWVVAETASKIPSDQPAPKGLRPFSARQFIGTEGDAVSYPMPEGYERTEQTWVHPPELETGGRDTGQTWPMEFGNEKTPAKSSRSRSSKAKQSRKPLEPQLSTMQQART